ncbi:MAG: mechanosensitive ion channel protein MscS, partial [Paraburkholderia sp.]
MQSCPLRRESGAAPSNGGQPATHATFHFSSNHVGCRARRGVRAHVAAWLGAWAATVCAALILGIGWMPVTAQAAGATTPVIPALQSLI